MATDTHVRSRLFRRGFLLEYITLGWNVVGVAILAFAAITAGSVALAGFGLDSLIEIGASAVVIWELSGTGAARRRRALRPPCSPSPGASRAPVPRWTTRCCARRDTSP